MPKILFICAYQLLYIVEPQQFAECIIIICPVILLLLLKYFVNHFQITRFIDKILNRQYDYNFMCENKIPKF